ncbi:hypothetical protein [Aquipuribacter nitratireducens]|uniref:Uncharacterized protein n=1 Tax=Aquipuribacter nitratireducens TaxID=650104 RepID=A0ABW0GJT3_9MICO
MDVRFVSHPVDRFGEEDVRNDTASQYCLDELDETADQRRSEVVEEQLLELEDHCCRIKSHRLIKSLRSMTGKVHLI